MPLFKLKTNVSAVRLTADFLKSTSELVSKLLDKPATNVVFVAEGDVKISFGGTADPCISASLHSIGKIGVEENKRYSQALSSHFEQHLGVAPSRTFILFENLDRSNVGKNGTTLA